MPRKALPNGRGSDGEVAVWGSHFAPFASRRGLAGVKPQFVGNLWTVRSGGGTLRGRQGRACPVGLRGKALAIPFFWSSGEYPRPPLGVAAQCNPLTKPGGCPDAGPLTWRGAMQSIRAGLGHGPRWDIR
jgi:hypothetical protein